MNAQETTHLQVGQDVPDFEMTTFEPTTGEFGTYSLKENKKAGKWSVLVFYPADFTFVCATEFAARRPRRCCPCPRRRSPRTPMPSTSCLAGGG
jgi:alkyl hydroperoxide reductase subunit AhpC